MNSVDFNKGQGGLGRPLPGRDYISGLIFYCANGKLPSGFSTSARMKHFYAPSDATAAGILNDYSDETQATGVYTLTNIGANADTLEFTFTEPEGKVISLGKIIKTSSESTVTLLAAKMVAAINALTYIHGYSAANTAGAITFTVRKGLGVFPNSGTPLTMVTSGTIAGSTTTAFAGGVTSLQAIWYYHISEFFRMQPKGELYVGFFAVPGTYDYAELTTMRTFSEGAIRQFGIYKDGTALDANADTSAIQAQKLLSDTAKQGFSVILGADISGTGDISTLADMSIYNNPGASVVIAQDGAGLGNQLWYSYGKSITTLGATLGAVAFAAVNEDIAWVGKFNFSNGYELDTLAFANGVKYKAPSITTNLLESLNNRRYIFLLKISSDVPGSYISDSHTATAVTSDYAYIENVRTIDKAIRGINTYLTPLIASPLLLNADGTLRDTTVAYFEEQADTPVLQMQKDSEISARLVTINPNQNVASTSKLIIAVEIVPVGVARKIIVNIGFVTSI
jgi:hypothetical protein